WGAERSMSTFGKEKA
nr:Chain P, Wirs [synthetic construct]